jgi:hypothetical protein
VGGSGGGLSLPIGRLAELEEKAKAVLREGDVVRRNLFISFAHEDMTDVNLLRGQAKNASSGLEFNDWSLKEPFDSDKAEYIKRGIRERIRQSSATLVYVSAATCQSKWVDWEIRESLSMGKRVIAMFKGDNPPAQPPSALTEHRIPLVPWNHEAIMAAINDE